MLIRSSLLAMLLAGCAANKPHVDNEIEAVVTGGEYGACTVKIKAQDGGTFRDWEKCACGVDTDHHVDSGKCGP